MNVKWIVFIIAVALYTFWSIQAHKRGLTWNGGFYQARNRTDLIFWFIGTNIFAIATAAAFVWATK